MSHISKPINIDYLCRLYLSGKSELFLAKDFKISRSAIRMRLLRGGIAPRGRSEAMFVRMGQTTQKERTRLTKAAHDAVRGMRRMDEDLCKRAATREIRRINVSPIEAICAEALRSRGFSCICQKAVGSYNIDVAITEPPIAVEIFGGHWHTADRHAARFRKRTDYLLDQGWLPVIVWVGRDYPFGIGAIEYIVTLAEKMRRGESIGRKEQMIWGNGQPSTLGERKLNGLPPIPGPQPYDKTTGRFTKRPR